MNGSNPQLIYGNRNEPQVEVGFGFRFPQNKISAGTAEPGTRSGCYWLLDQAAVR
jgi:hypothetical protein